MKAENPKAIVFTDIDGTVLNEENSCQETKPLVNSLLTKGAALVFCSSKTRAEVEFCRKELQVDDPFISENGGAIFIPKSYFSFAFPFSKQTNDYYVIELGAPYSAVRRKLLKASSSVGVEIVGFGDMTARDLELETGLPWAMAVSAKNREYDEPFRLVCGDEKALTKALEAEGLTLTAGNRYFHVVGDTDKGKAAVVLKSLFALEVGTTMTFGVGDSRNDLSMLAVVDVPLLVRKKMGGKNANLVAWRNLSALISDST